MSKKNAVFSIIVLLVIMSFCFFLFYPIKTNDEDDDQQTEISAFISLTPKSSSYEVSKRWNCTSDYEVLSVAVSADGNYMVAGINYDYAGYSGHAIFFFNTSVHNGRPMWIYNTTKPITSVAISKDGEYIVAAGPDEHKAYLLNKTVPETGNKEEVWYVKFPSNEYIYSVDISANGQFIVIGGEVSGGDGFILLFNNTYNSTGGHDKTGEKLWYYAPYSRVNSVTISANGIYVAAGTNSDLADDEVFFFNTTEYTYNKEHNPEWSFNVGYSINSIAISDNGFYFVAASYAGNRAFLLNKTVPNAGIDKEEVWIVNWGNWDFDIYSIDISADGQFIGIGGRIKPDYEGYIGLYNNSYPTSGDKTNEYLWDYTLGVEEKSVNSVAITAYGEYIALGTDKYLQEDTVFLFNNTDYTYNQEHKPEWSFNTSYNINSVSISSWGNYIGAGGNYSSNRGMTYLFYHARPLPIVPLLLLGDDDDDDDGNNEVPPVIPFGNHYLIFTAIGIVSLVIILKRKLFLSKE